ncbi:MAG: galactokinase [Candidatus Limnocylindria bacterium]
MTARGVAHGRVNLIGEHTDYNAGHVLPVGLPHATRVTVTAQAGSTAHISSDAFGEAAYELGRETRRGDWADHVQGVTAALREAGRHVPAFGARVASDVPIGAGLASSAALGVALAKALRGEFRLDLDDTGLALLAQRAENDFVGARVGVMDQLAAALLGPGEAALIDTRSLAMRAVVLPAGSDLVVVDSGARHRNAGGEYNTRRGQCEEAARQLGLHALRDVVRPEDVEALPEPLRRRARHVVSENARVLAMAECLGVGDVESAGALLDASHRSLRDDFEVSTPAIDAVVTALQADPDVLGARITGGGFGGSVLALARAGRGADVADRAVGAARHAGLRSAGRILPVPAAVPPKAGDR